MPGPWDANLLAFNNQTLTSSTNSAEFNVGEGAELRVQLEVAGTVSDASRNRRHDFFVLKRIKLPANLNINRYVLKVTIVDKQANRIAEGSLPVQVLSK